MKTIKSIKATAMNKGRARIWIEGDLSEFGFVRGTPITITVGNGRVLIAADTEGKRIMAGRSRAGKKDIQILDICMPQAYREAIRFNCSKFTVSASQGFIIVEADLSTQQKVAA
jgi:hypothetical protein